MSTDASSTTATSAATAADFSSHMKIGGVTAGELVATYGSPLFVYDRTTIQQRCSDMIDALSQLPTQTKLLYACKANTNVQIIKLAKDSGVAGIDAVSLQEAQLAMKAGFAPSDIQFTENFVGLDELEEAVNAGLLLCIGELDTLEELGKRLKNNEIKSDKPIHIAVRINPDVGSGECSYTVTGGPKSKFGIYCNQLTEIQAIAAKYNITIEGIHQHIGSNIVQSEMDNYVTSIRKIFSIALAFPSLAFINVGGGIGVPYKDGVEPLNLREAYEKVSEEYLKFRELYGRDVEIRVEPGRYLVAESGFLLTKVTAVKKNQYSTWVGTDTGMNHLIRPALYGSYHKVSNASNAEDQNAEKVVVNVCGNVCESADVFGIDRELSKVQDHDILAIYNAGAYGYCMSSNYNSRNRPAEVLVGEGQHKLIRRRETLDDQLATQIL